MELNAQVAEARARLVQEEYRSARSEADELTAQRLQFGLESLIFSRRFSRGMVPLTCEQGTRGPAAGEESVGSQGAVVGNERTIFGLNVRGWARVRFRAQDLIFGKFQSKSR